MAVTGVYQIRNTITDKVYIGSSVDIEFRWNRHKKDLKAGCHHSVYLQRSYDKYGKDAFEFAVVEETSEGTLIEREQYWIDTKNSYEDGYNSRPVADSPLGYKHTDETKAKMSKARLGKSVNKGKRSGNASLTDEQVIEIKTRLANGEKQRRIAVSMGVTTNIVNRIAKGKTYANIIIKESI